MLQLSKGEFQHTTPETALKFLWQQVLMGDSTDGIPGLPGVGAKTSENWLKNRRKILKALLSSMSRSSVW